MKQQIMKQMEIFLWLILVFLKKFKRFVINRLTEATIVHSKKNMIDIDKREDYILATKYN